MSDENYRLTTIGRDVVRFGRLPGQLPIDDLPMCYSELGDYYRHVLAPNRDRLDYVIVEEYSLATTLRDDKHGMALYLTPLVDGHIVEGTINTVITLTGWFVVCFDYIDEHNEEFTALYFSPTPPGTVMNPDGGSFASIHYTTVN